MLMKNGIPSFLINSDNRTNICIICEGYEEYEYLARLKSLGVWSENYSIILVNAKGNGNIPARYQDKFQNGLFEVVFVFCDTEKKPYEQYIDIKRKINEIHGMGNIADQVIIYANPCTMQIILSHFQDVNLTTASKRVNATVIEECTGIKNYKARMDQLKILVGQITENNYQEMSARVKLFLDDDTELGSSNFIRLIEYLSSEHDDWVQNINKQIGL